MTVANLATLAATLHDEERTMTSRRSNSTQWRVTKPPTTVESSRRTRRLWSSQEGAGARFGGRRNEDRERSEGLRLGEVSSRRTAPAGKNPFGQISASGTFKPAGTPGGGRGLPRDGNVEGLGEGRRGMGERSGSYGKDRMREILPDDRRRDPARDRRRGERGDADEIREEGEIDSPRMRRTGGADTASDWRRPGDRDRAGPFSNTASDRLRPSERRGGQRAGGAPWAGDADDNPAWLEDDSEPLPVDNRAPFGQFGSRRKEADGFDDPHSRGDDMGGAVDSIQAFKAQMKERERRERLARVSPNLNLLRSKPFSMAQTGMLRTSIPSAAILRLNRPSWKPFVKK